MDCQSPIIPPYSPERMEILRFASYILPPSEYRTRLLNFPITNCHEPYGTSGNFFLTLTIYQDGARFARVDLPVVNQDGFFEFEFDTLYTLAQPTKPAIMIAQYSHDKAIPVELYLSNTHRKTGTYLAYPTLSFMGDTLYPSFHETALENTLFWPGLPRERDTEAEIIIVNPYKLKAEYQLSLFRNGHRRAQTEVLSIAPYSGQTISIAQSFPTEYSALLAHGGDGAVCISAQYKVVAFMSMRHLPTNIITVMDHLHPYQLA